jgi:hypothetical protein
MVGLLTGSLSSIADVRLFGFHGIRVMSFDPVSYCAAAFLLITVFLSGESPARRAGSVEPIQALRTE